MREETITLTITNVRKESYRDIEDWLNYYFIVKSKIKAKNMKVSCSIETSNLGLFLFTVNSNFRATRVFNRGVSLHFECSAPTIYEEKDNG